MHVSAHTTLLSLILPFLPSLTRAALQHRPLTAQPQDPFAAPKFEVSFLNHRPISVSDAKDWQIDDGSWSGLRGFEAMDAFVHGVKEPPTSASSTSKKTIGDSGATSQETRPNIVKLRLPAPSLAATSPLHDYLCLLPSPSMVQPTEADSLAHEEALRAAEEVPDPKIGWESLRHLDGKCLYSKQGWFSYSYCHDSHVRQFREAPHQHPHPPGGMVPVEDHDFQAYNLGLSPSLVKKSTSSSSSPSVPSVSVSRNAHARYLTQSWSSGTICDKTGLPRKVEVQFHCKMGGVDHIGFIKEVSTCKYVLVIYTPNLCSLPGFSSSTPDDTPLHPIQCRRIIPDGEIEAYVSSLDGSSSEEGPTESMDELAALDRYPDMNGEQAQAMHRLEEDRKAQGYRFPIGYYPGYSTHESRIYEEPVWTVQKVEVEGVGDSVRDLRRVRDEFERMTNSMERLVKQDAEPGDVRRLTDEIEQMTVDMEQLVEILTQQVEHDDAAAEAIGLVRQRLKDAVGGGLQRQIEEAFYQAVLEMKKQSKNMMDELRSMDHREAPQEVSKLKNKLNDVLSKDPKVREEQIRKMREENIAKKKAKEEERDQLGA